MTIAYDKLFNEIKQRIDFIHDSNNPERNNRLNEYKSRRRASMIFSLDIAVIMHRDKYRIGNNELRGRDALTHLLVMKHHWLPSEASSLSLSEVFQSLDEELLSENFPKDAKTILRTILEVDDASIMSFKDLRDEEWDPLLYLKHEVRKSPAGA